MPYEKWIIPDFPGGPLRSKKCLRWMVTEKASYLLHLYEHYEKGFLLYAGGIYDQPAIYSQAMQIIGHRVHKIQLEKLRDGRKNLQK